MGCVLGDGEDRRLECLQGVEVERLVRLNQALGVNLKPNEDLDDAGEDDDEDLMIMMMIMM